MNSKISLIHIKGKIKDLDGFAIVRNLPTVQKRFLGPFVFLDHMGALQKPQQNLDVRPHPHIGLATITYLTKGRGLHRDSLKHELIIQPHLKYKEELESSSFSNLKIKIKVNGPAEIALLGGTPHPEERHIWWNFVSSDKDKIRKAAQKWKSQNWQHVINETEFIPLPEHPPL